MRDVIALALAATLALAVVLLFRLLLPAGGRHAADPAYRPAPTPEPTPVNPWARPWRSPSKEEAAEIFRQQAENTLELHPVDLVQLRRRIALCHAEGAPEDEYPYTYPGAPFPASAFTAAKATA